ncbi:MAG: hypothetical protein ACTSP3_03590 [Candidatus Heimdallarchaeaceae archaeon]
MAEIWETLIIGLSPVASVIIAGIITYFTVENYNRKKDLRQTREKFIDEVNNLYSSMTQLLIESTALNIENNESRRRFDKISARIQLEFIVNLTALMNKLRLELKISKEDADMKREEIFIAFVGLIQQIKNQGYSIPKGSKKENPEVIFGEKMNDLIEFIHKTKRR